MPAQHPNLERVRDLMAAAHDARRHSSYIRIFDHALTTHVLNPKILASYEQDLRKLDAESWRGMKAAAFKRLIRNQSRRWEPLFGMLNEAKAYAHLVALGCADIEMIPSSYDAKTPDLKATLNGSPLLCEVKTLHLTDDPRIIATADPNRSLSQGFLSGKLTRTIHDAKIQIDAFPSEAARKLIYVVLNPDESLNDVADDYTPQLSAFLKTLPLAGVEVEVFQFPASCFA